MKLQVSLLLALPGCVYPFTQSDTDPPSNGSGIPGWTSTVDTGVPFVAPECTAAAPPTPVVGCSLGVDAAAVAACGADAALLDGVGYATVQEALNAASVGAMVTVCPGTWGPATVSKSVVLEAADATPGATVFSGDGALTLTAAATVRGLTLRDAGPAGAVNISAAGAVLDCLTIEDNRGPGVLAPVEGLTITASTLRGNEPALIVSSDLYVEDTSFEENWASYEGGAAQVSGDATFTRCAFLDNVADYGGGAIVWGERTSHTLTIEDSLFHCNAAGYHGGAVTVGSWGADTAVISGSTFTHNFAGYEAGAVSFDSWGAIDATIRDTTFAHNRALYEGGAVEIGGWLEDGATATLEDVTFTDNATQNNGSAFSVGSRVPFGTFTADGLVMLRNQGGSAALSIVTGTTFDCTGCDMGAGADDNAPADAEKGGTTTPSLGASFSL